MTNQELLTHHTPLVNQIAGAFMKRLPPHVLKEDMIAAGMVGLWNAIIRHDPSKDGFEWYCRVKIRGAILDELRAQDWLPRRARARAELLNGTEDYCPPPAVVRFDDVSLWEQQKCLSDDSNSEAVCQAKEAHEGIFAALDTLPERERFIIAQHYFEGVKFKDLAQQLKVSDARISQLHSRAMAKLRARHLGLQESA